MSEDKNPFLHGGVDGRDGTNGPDKMFDAKIAEQFMRAYLSLSDEERTAIISSSLAASSANGHGTDTTMDNDHADPEDNNAFNDDTTAHDDNVSRHHDHDKHTVNASDGVPDVDDSHDDGIIGTGDDVEEDGDWRTFDEIEEEDDDSVLIDNVDSGAVKLTDRIITYETNKFINPKTDKPYNRFTLMKTPPVLTFKQHHTGTSEDEDETVSIIMTRALAEKLHQLTGDILKAYNGIPLDDKNKEPVTLKNIKGKIQDMWTYEPVKLVITVIISLIIIALVVYGFLFATR